MVRRVDLDLDVEEILGDSDVVADALRHRIGGSEERGEGRLVCLDERVFGIHHVEGGRAFVRVDHHFDRVADVVDVVALEALRLGVGVGRGRGVRIHDPDQASVDDDDVRVGVERQKRRKLLYPVADVAAVEHQALVADLTRDEEAEVAELQRPERAVYTVHRHAMFAGVARKDVLAPLRVIELLGVRGRDHIPAVRRGQLSEVDAGLGDRDRTCRRQVVDDVVGQAFADHRVDGAGRDAVAVRVGESLVDPVLG